MAVDGLTTLAVPAAISLTATAAQSRLLVPNLALPDGPPGVALAAVEVLIAFTFMTGAEWLGALALIELVLWNPELGRAYRQPPDVQRISRHIGRRRGLG